ncbi:MAG: hydroxymethylglutaryl-CoA reductase, degradative [Deltaproteobacteria bacterium]|nr:hydroxymethylglutaryl-CoA reductase, degradative [Deltaproteobacteria bacterium]
MKSSELSGFYRLSMDDRRARVAEVTGLSFSELLALSATCGLSDEQANGMVENVLGVTSLPLGVCVNLRVDGRDCLVPMATEEPSVIAGASHAAKLLRLGGGVSTEVSPAHMVGQVQLLDVPNPEEAIGAIQAAKTDLLARANDGDPQLVAAGGGALDLELHLLQPLGPEDPAGPMLVVHLVVDVRDAMGANAINSMCERIAAPIERLSRGRVGLRILSNLADRRTVVARGSVPLAALGGRGETTPEQLARRIVEASVFAERDPYRAATHNKGIMNGIDAVLLALGQDWRAVEAGAHAYAARHGRYTALARWRLSDQSLTGELELPMAVGTIGGVQGVHPTVQVSRRLAHVGSAAELASIVAAVGLTQNLSALRALSAEGIQRGHMRLHARNVAAEAGATGDVIDEVAEAMASRGTVSLSAAKEALAQREVRRREASRIPARYQGEGDDSLIARFSSLRDQYWPAIADHIDQVVDGTTPEDSSLTAMCGYHMDTGGKRLRALLPLMVAEALGESPDKLVALGAACEMLHNATLVHDDLQDGDLVRRGQMTVWNRFGVPQAINLGDAMFYFAVLLCQRVDAPAPRRETLVRRLLTATLRVIDGQEREFGLKARGNVSLDDYCTMVEGKTSGLFALPMAGAAELCGAPAELIAGLEEAARHLGVLFQIQDDTLDLYGDKGRELRGSDIAEGKRSALVVHALEHAGEDDARWLLGVLDKERTKTSREEIAEAARLLETTGSLRFALDEIRERRERAAQVPAVMAHEALQSLVVAMSDLFLKPIAPLLER